MQLRNTSSTYGLVSKSFHWIIAVLVIGMLSVGYFLDDMPDAIKGTVYNLHKLTGITILLLMLLRLVWTLMNPKPKLPAKTPLIEVVAERLGHWAIYAAVIAMPLAGWIGSSAAGKGPKLFGDMRLSLPIALNKSVSDTAFEAHEWLAIIIICLLTGHILAALYHHFIRKDNVLKRML